ncbi:hypothetical protein [Streptomyces sp. NPDC056821]|uniref:hypothetical protein n=1 Tax=unclassified Streptomyces TaxID=2593676 RepID=UPI0036789A94
MRHPRELLIDAWSWLNYKQAMADLSRPGQDAFPELNTSWVPGKDLRRLAAYKFLAAYDSNQAGQLASVTGDNHGVERRELGDPSKLIDTTLGYLLGAEQTIVVPGADHAGQDKRAQRQQLLVRPGPQPLLQVGRGDRLGGWEIGHGWGTGNFYSVTPCERGGVGYFRSRSGVPPKTRTSPGRCLWMR